MPKDRTIHDRKLVLFRQLKSHSVDLALDAIDQLRKEGWWDEMRQFYTTENGRINLEKVNWTGANNLQGINLQDTDLKLAVLQSANLWEANLHHAELGMANLHDAKLGFANLEQARMERANLQQVILASANLQNAFMVATLMLGATLHSANLKQAYLRNARLDNANLYEANLQDANLTTVNLQGANIKGADFRGARMKEANLLHVKNLEDAIFDEKTILPDAKLIAAGQYDKVWTPDTDMTRYTNPEHPDYWESGWAKSAREYREEFGEAPPT